MASDRQSSSESPDGVSNTNAQNFGPESPYYVDPNGTPEEVTLVLSGSNNYPKWYRAMSVALTSENKLGFADGTIAIPAKNDPIYGAWKRCNQLLLSRIVGSVSPEIANKFRGMDNAVYVWTTLKKSYSPGDLFIISDILDEIYSLRQGDLDVTRYFEKLSLLWKQLEILRPQPACNCEKKCSSCDALIRRVNKQREEEKVARFLKGLNDRFAATRSQIMREDPLPSIDQVHTWVVLHEETQLASEANQAAHQSQPPSSSSASHQLVIPKTQPTKNATEAEQTTQPSQGLKQHQSQSFSPSNEAVSEPQHGKEVSGTKKQLVHSIHPHPLTLKPPGAPYECSGCQELGFGPSYRCEDKECRYILHEECASAVLDKSPVHHSFFNEEEFSFLEKPLGRPRVCDACRKDVQGFVYHRPDNGHPDDTGLDLHICCFKLKKSISHEERGVTVTLKLCRKIPKKCAQCKSKKVGNERKVKGWAYVSPDEKYCYHVSCVKELIIMKWKEGYFSEEKIVRQTYEPKTQIALTSKKMVGSSKGSGATKTVCKTAAGVLQMAEVVQMIVSAIFGVPIPPVASIVLAIAQAVVSMIRGSHV